MFEIILPLVIIGSVMTVLYVVAKTIMEYLIIRKMSILEKKIEPKGSEISHSLQVENGNVKSQEYKNISFYKRINRMRK